MPLPTEMDNTTAELLALALGHWIAGCISDLVAGCRHCQRDPLRKAIPCSVAPCEAVHCGGGATWEPRMTMTTTSGGSKEMPGPMNVQASQHGRAPEDTGWPSPYHWKRRKGRGVRMAHGGWSGAFTSRGTSAQRDRWTLGLKSSRGPIRRMR